MDLILCVLPLVALESRRFLEPPLCLIESASLSTSARFILSLADNRWARFIFSSIESVLGSLSSNDLLFLALRELLFLFFHLARSALKFDDASSDAFGEGGGVGTGLSNGFGEGGGVGAGAGFGEGAGARGGVGFGEGGGVGAGAGFGEGKGDDPPSKPGTKSEANVNFALSDLPS